MVQAVLPPAVRNSDAADVDNALTGWYSPVIRRGVSETVVFLAVNGRVLFKDWSDFAGAPWTEAWVRERLMPITAERLETVSRDLAFYAETAPVVFLDLLEEDLRQPDSEVLKLMRSKKQGWMETCPWSGLLNALEVLARLAAVEPRDSG